MPTLEAPCVELGSAPEISSIAASPSPSEVSSASSPEPQNIRATPLFRALARRPPEPDQPTGQDELERRLPGYRRIVIPRELTLIELLKQYSGVATDDEVLYIREAKLRVIAERVGLRRLHVLAPRLRSLTLDGSAVASLRDLGVGLVHLKFLSVNRCTLTSLDGVWGLGSLRELHAAGNRLQDLHPLAALQKLHTLDLANNPIANPSRLWTLGVCSSLRTLVLRGTPAADTPDYRARVADALPLLTSLDDHPIHMGIISNAEGIFESSSSSESEDSDHEPGVEVKKLSEAVPGNNLPLDESSCGVALNPQDFSIEKDPDIPIDTRPSVTSGRRRPATTESAGTRPVPPILLPRPKTAHERKPEKGDSRLHVMNTLMDEEWQCSGSKLTSHAPVCGNLTHALRRSGNKKILLQPELPAAAEETMEGVSRALAAEIPRAPCLEDWDKFRKETGIEIEINFDERPVGMDATRAIERLEEIEKQTSERLFQEAEGLHAHQEIISANPSISDLTTNIGIFSGSLLSNDSGIWQEIQDLTPTIYASGEIDDHLNERNAPATDQIRGRQE